jgi:hypothetical protein
MLLVAVTGWHTVAPLHGAPAWEGGGPAFEVSDLKSVVVSPAALPIEDQPPLPPEPSGPDEEAIPAPAPVPDGIILEDKVVPAPEEAPTISERIQSFVPDGLLPGSLMPDSLVPSSQSPLSYDSAAILEPDGTVAEAPAGYGILNRLCCLPDACWVVRAEGLALWRSAPATRPLLTTLTNYDPGPPATGTLGPTVLDANQLVSDPAAAGRLSLARVEQCGRGVDLAYLWAGNFYAQRTLPDATDSYALAYPGIYGNSWGLIPPAPPISAAQMQLVSSLQSAEFNFREPLGWGATKFLIGFRWLQWREAWSMTDQYLDPLDPTVTGTDFWRTSCLNNLYGGQIGLDSMLWNTGKGLRLEGLVKAGAYYNAAVQSSGYSYVNTFPFQSPYATATVNHPPTCSFMGEVGLTGVLPLHKNLDLRVGYVGMWLAGLAQPTRQLSGQTLIPSAAYEPAGTLTTNGSVILQGVSLGLEGRW